MAKPTQKSAPRDGTATLPDQLVRELRSLEHEAARTTDSCIVATVIALSDDDVQRTLLGKFEEGDLFIAHRCLGVGQVLFEFACPPGRLCLMPPSFLVQVDIPARRVIRIDDPFISTASAQLTGSPAGMLFKFAAANGGGSHPVDVALSGGFFHGEISVDGRTVPLFNGKGHDDVTLVPPNVDVVLLLLAHGPTEFKSAVSINGRTKTESDTIPGGKATRLFSYPFSDFGL